ncbi:MAG TPA: M28 family peptidase [Isosphaeraceae bacterium]|nr:M28 family peptidase [Isosphaeraceae bacterium]
MSQINFRRAQLRCLAAAFAVVLLGSDAAAQPEEAAQITPEVRSALGRISADSLRGHLSFLASDLLEGRGTPSRGLDLAAEYIAAQFRRAGLEAIGDDGYFQTALWPINEPSPNDIEVVFHLGDDDVRVPIDRISLRYGSHALDLRRVHLVKLGADAAAALERPGSDLVKDKVILLEDPDVRGASQQESSQARSSRNRLRARLSGQGAALLVSLDRRSTKGSGLALSRRTLPFSAEGKTPTAVPVDRTPELIVHDPILIKRLDSIAKGETAVTVSLHMAAPVRTTAKVRNVIGLLRGSDPKLRDTYVLVTAHYDHLGLSDSAEATDKTFNGANDDGSGTVSVIELASALATVPARPKRSLIFMTFFGEERGMLGSRYYVRHPVVPLDETVADVNLEQLGRTDASDGPQSSAASITGFDYSSLGTTFQRAGQRLSIRVSKNDRFSDRFFMASDNVTFARRGIPAHTICVAYLYPDYHGLGDHWEKVDYVNMARVDRMLALGLLMLANDPERPKWNESNAKAATYARAAKQKG